MVNQWIQHVKQYANQHGCSYSDALKRAKSSYQSTSKPRRKSSGKGMINYDDIRGQPIMITGDYRGPNDPRKAYMKGRGNFWEDIKPATKYLQPVGDAMMKKAIEKINGLGLKNVRNVAALYMPLGMDHQCIKLIFYIIISTIII